MRITKLITLIAIMFLANASMNAQKNFEKEANAKFMNEAYFTAIDLYKKAETKEKRPDVKARLNFQIAECYRFMIEPEQAETYYKRAIMLKYNQANPEINLLIADVIKEQGDRYKEASEYYEKYLAIKPDSKKAKDGKASCKQADEWSENPTKHIIQDEIQLNTDHFDYSPSWGDKKHNVLIFSSSRVGSTGDEVDDRTGESYMDLYTTTRDNKGKWGEPQLLPETINTPDNEGSSVITKKGDMLFFTRCPREKKENIGCDIFVSTKQGDNWKQASKVVLKPEGGDSISCGHPTLNTTSTIMIFSSDLPGGQGGKDLWFTEYNKREKSWGIPVNLGAEINTPGDEMFPHITSNGDLYFSSNGYIGLGGLDMYKSESLGNKTWGNVENLKYPLNSSEHDFGIIFETGTTSRGFFTSDRHSSGGKGKDDIFSFHIPDIHFSLHVYVTNKVTNEPIPGVSVLVKGSDGSEVVKTTDAEGKVKLESENKKQFINKETSYNIEVAKDEYLIAKNQISTVGQEKSKRFIEEVYLQPAVSETGEAIVIDFPEVQYAYDKSELLVDARINSNDSLDYLYSTLIENPNIVIELQAHTDCRGKDRYNKSLSQKRAQACVDYLISKGIPADRMVPVGKGESTPRAEGLDCAAIEKMGTLEEQEAAHQRNRRTQFTVLSFDYGKSETPEDK
jgi:peptidoglycan-associated lipoprotein